MIISSMTYTSLLVHPSKRLTAKKVNCILFPKLNHLFGPHSPNWVLYESILQIVPFSLNDGWE